jgi:hypothetical protein
MALNIQNGRKMFQMAKNMPTFSILRPAKIYPNWELCIKNIPSGNLDQNKKTRKS